MKKFAIVVGLMAAIVCAAVYANNRIRIYGGHVAVSADRVHWQYVNPPVLMQSRPVEDGSI